MPVMHWEASTKMDAKKIIMFSFPLDQILCQTLKYPEASVSCCMPRSFEWRWCRCVGVLLALSLSLTCFSLPISISLFLCACCGSRTLCNAYESTPSGEVPLRRRVCRTHFSNWKAVPVKDISKWGHQLKGEICSWAAKLLCHKKSLEFFHWRVLMGFWWICDLTNPIARTLNGHYVKCQS